MKFVAISLALLLSTSALAQAPFADPANLAGERVPPRDGRELPIDGGLGVDGRANTALALQQVLRKLNTRASILNIVAHPDDEDGGMLTFYARGFGARVADLSLTRGEGGQNAMTGDFEDALGLLRTQELLANDRYTGVSQMFGTEVDFGFSKTKSEAFAKWTRQRVLYDAVRAIRLYRPLVITATFIGGVTDGHGQHQVSGEIAQEAFLAAGDPTVFPELTREGILPWQPLRMYARVPRYAISQKGLFDYATGQYVAPRFTNYITGITTTTPPSTDVIVHEGATDPLLTPAAANPADLLTTHFDAPAGAPLSYVQFARIGLGLQRSQIPAGFRMPPAGTFDVPYHLYGSCPTPDHTPCHPAPEQNQAQRPASQAPSARHNTAQAEGGDAPSQAPSARHNTAQAEGGDAPSQAPSARHITAQAEGLGRPSREDARAESPAQDAASADANFFTGIDTGIEGIADLAPHAPPSLRLELRALAKDLAEAQMDLQSGTRQELIGKLQSAAARALCLTQRVGGSAPPNPDVACDLPDAAGLASVSGAELANVRHELRVKQAQLTEALLLARDIQAQATAPANDGALLPGVPFLLTVHASSPTQPVYAGGLQGTSVRAEAQDRPSTSAQGQTTTELRVSETESRRFPPTLPYFHRPDIEQPFYDLSDPALRNAPQTPWPLIVRANLDGLQLVALDQATSQPLRFVPPAGTPEAKRLQVIGYGDLPRTDYIARPAKHVSLADLKLPAAHRLAYLPGTGDAVPQALASIGLAPTLLTVADLTPAKLQPYDTVILGVRTYAAHPDLHGAPTQALLDYARNGGNVLVQYQTDEFTAADAPFPLTLGRDAEKVVDETDPVELLAPDNPLLTTPNRITPADFNGWIEERGHGFLSTWDPRYTALTETHDPGAPGEGIAPQEPQRGGLVTVSLGKGRWTYCAFALYRQLPQAVPGAFRLFLNLITPR